MLNISNNSVSRHIVSKNYSTLVAVEQKKSSKVLRKIIYWFFGIGIVILFLPWTQNIRSAGTVTTLRPEQRPQSLHSVIAGRIDSWYIQEGDFVNAGDTILKISEIKDAYFDPKLIDRTRDQVTFKKQSVAAYDQKINAQAEQLKILESQRELKLSQMNIKLKQTRLKVQNDSIAYEAAKVQLTTAKHQLNRQDSLYQLGLKSLTDLESRNLKYQEALAKETAARNKWFNTKNELINLAVERSNIRVKFDSDLNKVLSDRLSTISQKLDTETGLSKLENQFSNYQFRNGLYYLTAPQDGYITKASTNGIGETIKEGQEILTLMPRNYDLAVAMYVEPIDLPLVKLNEKVRIQFDGWPAIVFSGWPNASHGTYGGQIYAIDQYISANGKYRVLVRPDPDDYPWPEALRFGSGASTMTLLNDVPIWYELWRNINGFPPEYYTGGIDLKKTETKRK